ncbi:hypothetical protein NLJ89_g832 [Agrocybe chaxingu]|uniref:Protein kinase domain-containing protein n=1 Tax=Agrocybe chaxingu TaxID=84603 RepID=A0A9W8N197_9AGAR|nr:hypothetical protein NLJ89_g832 [Agrocybe chaxingu]
MSKKAPAVASPAHPPVGTLIDGGSLELAEVLGIGGYGVVYKATEAFSLCPRSYAVKCLSNANSQSSSRRQLHLREITLHQIASAHPSVVTLHRVIEELDCTFLVMEYAPDHDLFAQILDKCRYLGKDFLIKHVFLQLIEAVQYCHSLGIYHRDLKPENILCFDKGCKVAITDFGLATTDKASREFRTGSVYHMSPECQVEDSATTPPYSPMHNDIWSLGIILLNLVTGRNPWKSATPDDPTFQAYRRDPLHFLPTVLPISDELNNILIQALSLDWRTRLSLPRLRDAVESVGTFYSSDAILEGSLARCPWEADLDLGDGTEETKPVVEKRPVPDIPEGIEPYCVTSVSAVGSHFPCPTSPEEEVDECGWDGQVSEYDVHECRMDYDDEILHTPAHLRSNHSSFSSDPASPVTPTSYFDSESRCTFVDADSYRVYDQEGDNRSCDVDDMFAFPSFTQSSMDDSDDNRFASSVFIATPITESKPHPSQTGPRYRTGFRTEKRYSSPNTSVYSVAEESIYSPDSPTPADWHFAEKAEPESPTVFVWPEVTPRAGSKPIEIPRSRGSSQSKHKGQYIFNPRRFFPRSSGSSWLNSKMSPPGRQFAKTPPAAKVRPATPSPTQDAWSGYYPTRPVESPVGPNRMPPWFGSHILPGREWFPDFFALRAGS